MGAELSQQKKVINVPNLTQQLESCSQLSQRECRVYGTLHLVSNNNAQVEIGKYQGISNPNPNSLHFLVQPNILLLPKSCLLENYKINQYTCKKQILDIILGICELEETAQIGLGKNRVAEAYGKWYIYGEPGNPLWGYQSIVKNNNNNTDVYFSPEMMYALSKDKLYPKLDFQQSDIFVLAVMLLEIISLTDLQSLIYNFSTCQIKLGPILQALMNVEESFGKEIYEIIVKMLELQPQSRITFSQLKQLALNISSSQSCYFSPINSKITNLTPPPNAKPKSDSFNPSPTPSPQPVQKSGLEEASRGRSPGAIRKNLPLMERQNGKKSFSPIKHALYEASVDTEERNSLLNNFDRDKNNEKDRKKRVTNVCKITPNRVKIWQGMDKERPKVQPFGLRFADQGQQQDQHSKVQKKSFSKLKTIRF